MGDTNDVNLTQVVSNLDIENDDHWTKKGEPDLNHIKEAMGIAVTRDQMKLADLGDVSRTNPYVAPEGDVVEVELVEDDGAPESAEKSLGNDDADSDSGEEFKYPASTGPGWVLICIAVDEAYGTIERTEARLIVGRGCLVKVTTQSVSQDGCFTTFDAQSLVFVPSAVIGKDADGNVAIV